MAPRENQHPGKDRQFCVGADGGMLYNAVWSLGVARKGPEKTPSEPDQDNRLE